LTQNPSGGAKPRLDYDLEKASGILTIEPKAPLTVDDFKTLTADVDRYLASHDTWNGILLGVAHVPGRENFAAFIQHMRFVRDHQKRIARVAVLTDNSLLKIAPEIAAHLAHPEFRVFASGDRAGAVDWLKGAQA
jgi:hypothetical protein